MGESENASHTENLTLPATKTELQADLQVSLAETKAEILKWMVGTIGVQTVVILGAVVTIARLLPR
ncbi:MAG TPA: hypothetical protein VJX94_26515 [Stellaceae bacterium]|nr:hypothetical protein [Stellaceae bacterium]